MKPGKPPVVMLSGIRWNFLWQRHQILATRFARAGYKTVFVETTGLSNPHFDRVTLRKLADRLRRSGGTGEKHPEEPNLTVYSPLVAPPTWKAFRALNRRVLASRVARDLREIADGDPIVVAYPPTRTTLDLILSLRPRLLYYDCSEDYEGFPGIPKDIAVTEREILRSADVVSCTSPSLLEKVEPLRPDAFLNGPGVDYEQFAGLQEYDADRIRTVCYFGHLGPERIDLSALRAVAEAGFTVRILGGIGNVDPGFFRTPGIDHVGEVPHRKLPSALEGVDAFILPYLNNTLTRGISPAKTYECLATGKPVVASPLPALREISDHIYLAGDAGKFVTALKDLGRYETEEKVRARVELARKNSWDARFEEIEEKLWDALKTG
ncbi:glycosyltransferase family 1 protein [soil metagenome]